MEAEAIDRLYRATRETLNSWTKMLREEAGGKFPEKVTAFRGRDVRSRAIRAAVQTVWNEDTEDSVCVE